MSVYSLPVLQRTLFYPLCLTVVGIVMAFPIAQNNALVTLLLFVVADWERVSVYGNGTRWIRKTNQFIRISGIDIRHLNRSRFGGSHDFRRRLVCVAPKNIVDKRAKILPRPHRARLCARPHPAVHFAVRRCRNDVGGFCTIGKRSLDRTLADKWRFASGRWYVLGRPGFGIGGADTDLPVVRMCASPVAASLPVRPDRFGWIRIGSSTGWSVVRGRRGCGSERLWITIWTTQMAKYSMRFRLINSLKFK